MDKLRYWVGFNRAKGIGPARLRALVQHFGDVETAWKASPGALRETGLDQRTLASLLATRQSCDLDAELQAVERAGARVVLFDDDEYPPLLREIPDAPLLLYVRGKLTEADRRAIAVVGTRSATDYGRTMTQQIVAGLVQVGMTIVSGLAHGIDAVAHGAALRNGGRTIAVLPCGIERIYPPENHKLAEAIAASGALITEFALGSRPERHHFVPRNRIVSGLSLGVLVVEAGAKSGALITADQALEQGREVFAVPGSALSAVSAGPNALIRAGAVVATSAVDILEAVGLPGQLPPAQLSPVAQAQPAPSPNAAGPGTRPAYTPENEAEAAILRCLTPQPQHIDLLVQQSGLPITQVSSTLTVLELKGQVRQVGVLAYALPDPTF